MGNPILRRPADPVDATALNTPELRRLIRDMHETVIDADGAGLAAPQVHVSLQVVLLSLGEEPDGQFTVWINPRLTPMTDEHLITYEGCLSVPGLRGAVARPAKVHVHALTPDGEVVDRVLEDFPAVVAQHECDHLDGILYLDRVEPGTLMFLDEYRKFGPWPLKALQGEE
ncbi:MAG: peptide deformylase [Myxococcota bacterium]